MSSRLPMHCLSLLLLVLCCSCSVEAVKKPNIVFIITDDQDLVLGGMANPRDFYRYINSQKKDTQGIPPLRRRNDSDLAEPEFEQTPMPKTKKLIGDQGIIFENAFVTTPVCCPSRSSLFTGRYVHNHRAVNNSLEGNCSSRAWQQTQEITAFPTVLQANGYSTFFAGKYLNRYGLPRAGGVAHVPPGWDHWHALVGNSRFYNYSLSVNGVEEKHGDNYVNDYLTDVVHRRGREFLAKKDQSKPFFMMLSTPAPHEPFTPAPQYANAFSDMKAPRNGSYNIKAVDKHWLIRQAIVPLPNDTVEVCDDFFRQRWRTLLSVDDMVEDVVKALERSGELDNTYIFFTSDHGYHLGQFGMPFDKRQLYDFDVRVPFMVRGPGIASGQSSKELALNIDIAPTFAELAANVSLNNVDGKSLVPILHPVGRTQALRDTFLIEYFGEFGGLYHDCDQYIGEPVFNCRFHCVCEDAKNNTYGCVVRMTDQESLKYCELEDDEDFVEMYDRRADPHEITNLASKMDTQSKSHFSRTLKHLTGCAGPQCHNIPRQTETGIPQYPDGDWLKHIVVG